MHNNDLLTIENYSDDSPIACIDTQDKEFSFPIREFLETSGCRVFINSCESKNPTYHIICGDTIFVKTIAEKRTCSPQHTFCIVWSEDGSGIDSTTLHCKVAVTQAHILTNDEIQEMFRFFFTSDKQLLHLHRFSHEADFYNEIKQKPQISEITRDQEIHHTTLSRSPEPPVNEQPLNETDKERISETIKEVFHDQGKDIHVHKKTGKHRKFSKLTIIGFLICIPFIVMLWYAATLSISALSIIFAARELSGGHTLRALQLSRLSYVTNQQARIILVVARIPFRLVSLSGIHRQQEQLVSFLFDSSEALTQTGNFLVSSQTFSRSILSQLTEGSQVSSIASHIDEFKTELPELHTKYGLLSAELNLLLRDHVFPLSIAIVNERSMKAVAMLETIRSRMTFLQNSLALFELMAGFTKKQTYLLLLQNSSELRPTGGFIGSVGEVTFSQGNIDSFIVHDVYTPDGQLKGHVDPPKPIRDILGQEHWYLRDSNWDPDFSISGKTAGWFYEKETGTQADGVIAINTPFIIDLLRVTGPIHLSDYNDTITAENFFGKSLYYVEKNNFPGSTQKKDFLGNLTQELVSTLTNTKNINSWRLVEAMEKGLASHDIVFYFPDNRKQQLVDQYGWSGKRPDTGSCIAYSSSTSCTGDFLDIIEANLSVNKASSFIKRSRSVTITADSDGTLSYLVTAQFEHAASDVNNGLYKTYLQVFIPSDANNLECTADGTPIQVKKDGAKRELSLPYMEYDASASGSKHIGIAFNVAPGAQKNITLTYTRKKILVSAENEAITYEFTQPKQGGVEQVALTTIMVYPPQWSVTPYPENSAFLANNGHLQYNSTMSEDETLRVVVRKGTL